MNSTSATISEIGAQPDIWLGWTDDLVDIAYAIKSWMRSIKPDEVWFCGAGTSAYIGEILCDSLNAVTPDICFRSVPTTSLVSCPHLYLTPAEKTVLVVSFGRSGNSSETIGTLNLLDAQKPGYHRLNITCNADSILATRVVPGPGEQKTIVLPSACHDAGFAMTSSFTTMLLTALACFGTASGEDIRAEIAAISAAGRTLLTRDLDWALPSRVVFLGSGPFTGLAREAGLKVLELASGHIPTSWDSTMGFRHGPKAVVSDGSIVFVFLSNDPTTRRYDEDIVSEIRAQSPNARVVSIGAPHMNCPAPDVPIEASRYDIWNAALYIQVAQRLAAQWSAELGLNVDNPFANGNLSRVVSNVKLYC